MLMSGGKVGKDDFVHFAGSFVICERTLRSGSVEGTLAGVKFCQVCGL